MRYLFKWIFSAFLACICFQQALCCGVCGGGISFAGGAGINPSFQVSSLGLGFSHQQMKGTYRSALSGKQYEYRQSFSVIAAEGRYYIGRKLQLQFNCPFVHNTVTDAGQPLQVSGFGDLSLVLNGILYKSPDTLKTGRIRHLLMAGGGVDLPAWLLQRKGQEAIPAEMAPGYNSLGYIMQLSYAARLRNSGIVAESNTRISTMGTNGYRYGHRQQLQLRYLRWKEMGKTMLLPELGVVGEVSGRSIRQGVYQDDLAPYTVFASAGAQVYTRKFYIGINAQLPMVQTPSTIHTDFSGRLLLHFNYLITKTLKK